MSDVKQGAVSPKIAEPAPQTEAPRIDYTARPVKGEVDVRAWHREFAKRYPVIRAHLAK